jgi:hypothetical protein
VITVASWVNAVRQQVGVTGVSPIWDDVPAWYFWIAHGPGAYQLQMERAWRGGPGDTGSYRGLFSVKYFPCRTDPVFPAFSFHERSLVESDHFDKSNTPRFESRLLIPAPLFVVGTLEIACAPDDSWTMLSVESLDAIRATYRDDALEEYDLVGTNRSYKTGEVAREVPGWAISFGLFDRLVALFACRRKHGPSRVVLSRTPGFEYVFAQAGGWECAETSPTSMFCIHALFSEDLDCVDLPTALIEGEIERSDKEVLYDFSPPCHCPEHALWGLPESPFVNPLWWNIACADHQSDLTSLCGCS